MRAMSSITTCAVRAFSVVLIGQMCTWCTLFTPSQAQMASLIFSGSIPSGTASMLMRRLSERSFQVLKRMTPAMMRLTMGSITFNPVRLMAMPDITTPTDTSVSASMCRNAPRVLMSCLELRDSSHAVRPFMTIPTPAVQDTAAPFTDAPPRFANLWMLSIMIAPTATRSIMAFSRDIKTELFLYPYVYLLVEWLIESLKAIKASSRLKTSPKL